MKIAALIVLLSIVNALKPNIYLNFVNKSLTQSYTKIIYRLNFFDKSSIRPAQG